MNLGLAACKTLASCVLVQPDGWARGEREGYGGLRDVTSLSLSLRLYSYYTGGRMTRASSRRRRDELRRSTRHYTTFGKESIYFFVAPTPYVAGCAMPLMFP